MNKKAVKTIYNPDEQNRISISTEILKSGEVLFTAKIDCLYRLVDVNLVTIIKTSP